MRLVVLVVAKDQLLLAIITSCRSGGHNIPPTEDEVKCCKYNQSDERRRQDAPLNAHFNVRTTKLGAKRIYILGKIGKKIRKHFKLKCYILDINK